MGGALQLKARSAAPQILTDPAKRHMHNDEWGMSELLARLERERAAREERERAAAAARRAASARRCSVEAGRSARRLAPPQGSAGGEGEQRPFSHQPRGRGEHKARAPPRRWASLRSARRRVSSAG